MEMNADIIENIGSIMIKRIFKFNILLILITILFSISCQDTKQSEIVAKPNNKLIFDDNMPAEQDLEMFAKLVEHIWYNGKITDFNIAGRFSDAPQTIYLALRSKGLRLTDTWQTDVGLPETLVNAVNKTKQTINAGQIDNIDTLEIVLCHSFRELNNSENKERSYRIFTGAYTAMNYHTGTRPNDFLRLMQ